MTGRKQTVTERKKDEGMVGTDAKKDGGRKWRETEDCLQVTGTKNGGTDQKKYGGMRGKREGRKIDREEMDRDWEKGDEKEGKKKGGIYSRDRCKEGRKTGAI